MFGVHGVGGAIGMMLTGVFAIAAISIEPGRPAACPACSKAIRVRSLTQIVGVAVTVVWSGVCTFVILKVVGFITELRVTPEAEQMASTSACTASRSTPRRRDQVRLLGGRPDRLTKFYAGLMRDCAVHPRGPLARASRLQ